MRRIEPMAPPVGACAYPLSVESRVDLALHIVKEHFGSPAEVVYRLLVKREFLGSSYSTLLFECSAANVPEETARACLVLFLTQNVVEAVKPKRTTVLGKRKAATTEPIAIDQVANIINKAVPVQDRTDMLFYARVDQVLFRIRFPAVVEHVREVLKKRKCAQAAAFIVEQMCVAGRLKREAVYESVLPLMPLDESEAENERRVNAGLDALLERGLLENVYDASGREDGCWRLCFPGVMASAKAEDFVRLARDKFGSHGAELMRALLECCDTPEAMVEAATLSAKVEHPMSTSDVTRYLDMMVADQLAAESPTVEGCYSPDVTGMVDIIQKKIVEAIVFEKYGQAGCRLFNLLQRKGQLEEGVITDLALIPAVIVNERLHRMFRDEFLVLTEVPKTADYSAEWGSSFYLWTVEPERVTERVKRELCSVVKKMQQRLIFEEGQKSLLLKKVKAIEAQGEVAGKKLSEGERKEWEKLQKKVKTINASMLQIMNTYARLTWY